MPKSNSNSRQLLWSTCLGNFFEHYDTTLYAFLSPFLAPLLFPHIDPMTGLLFMYLIIPLGMLARPLGAVVFGHIGDNFGRQQALFYTLAGMSLVSGCLALSPTYEQAGVMAPIIFCLGRLLQNFLAAGETAGGAIYLLEGTDQKKHDILSSLFSASTIGGILFASAGVAVFSHFNLIEWGWRLLYFFGCMTAFLGLAIRKQASIQPLNISDRSFSLNNLFKIFFAHRKALGLIAIASGFNYANYSIALVLMNGLIPLVSPFTNAHMIALNTLLLAFDFCTLPLFGWLASKISREKVMIGASLGVSLTAIPLFMLLPQASFTVILLIRICLVTLGVAFCAPFYAWAQSLVPSSHRYTVVSFGYALGSQLLGGPTAAISLWIFKQTGLTSSIGWYWSTLAILSSLTLLFSFKLIKQPQLLNNKI